MVRTPEYALERLYDAPAELVWRGWTDPQLFSKWYGPNVETIIHKMDVKLGGECLIEMKWDGKSYYQKFEYIAVKPYERLSWAFAATNEKWEIIPSPHVENWPVVLISTMSLNMELGKPLMRFTWVPYNATDEQVECFTQNRGSVDEGWNASLKILDSIVAELNEETEG